MTELHDYLKLLFAKIAEPHCRVCGRVVARDTAESVATALLAAEAGARAVVVFRRPVPERLPWNDVRDGLRAAGYVRVLGPGGVVDLDDLTGAPDDGGVRIVQDRLVLRES